MYSVRVVYVIVGNEVFEMICYRSKIKDVKESTI